MAQWAKMGQLCTDVRPIISMFAWLLKWYTLILTYLCHPAKKKIQLCQPYIPSTAELVRDVRKQVTTKQPEPWISQSRLKCRIALQPDKI